MTIDRGRQYVNKFVFSSRPEELEKYLILFEPASRLEKTVQTVRDIYDNRKLLKMLPCSDFTVGHLATIVRNGLETRRRFRFVECVKVLRTIIASATPVQFERSVVDDLFAIYKAGIFSAGEPVQWSLSRMIKGQALNDEAVDWLLTNWRRSPHLVNRLLGYPTRNAKIEAWAAEVYERDSLNDRRADLLALLIHDRLPSLRRDMDAASLLWAIFKSGADERVKKYLLKQHALSAPEVALEIAMRRVWGDIVVHMIEEARRANPPATHSEGD